jgi:flagellar basal-body rod modification protein FlgD
MSVSATEGVTAGLLSTAASSATDKAANQDSKDMFLQLLVAQMKYQDPSNPADSSEFLSQSAQFTSLEKMQSIADQTGLLLGASMAFGSSSLVGRQVTYTLEEGKEVTGTVSSVEFGPNGPVLTVDGVEVPIANLLSVTNGSTPS